MTRRTLKRSWKWFFEKNRIPYSAMPASIPQKPSKKHMLVIVPAGVTFAQICTTFENTLAREGIGTESCARGRTLPERITQNIRTNEEGAYGLWVERHVKEKQDGTLFRKNANGMSRFDAKMTVLEGFLYHLKMMDEYGVRRYLNTMNGDCHACTGSRGMSIDGISEQIPWLRWDIHDLTVRVTWHTLP